MVSAQLASRVFTITATAERAGLNPLAYLTAYLQECAQAGASAPAGATLTRFRPWARAPTISPPGPTTPTAAPAAAPSPTRPSPHRQRRLLRVSCPNPTLNAPCASPLDGSSECLRDRVAALAHDGLDVAEGTALAERITERNSAAAHLHVDETSWKVFAAVAGKDSHRWWCWVFVGPTPPCSRSPRHGRRKRG
ncbi:MAG: IS66 family transposase [Pseudonocardia sp.]|nr:IS66 family transposase [Pseudonocardia sp.]